MLVTWHRRILHIWEEPPHHFDADNDATQAPTKQTDLGLRGETRKQLYQFIQGNSLMKDKYFTEATKKNKTRLHNYKSEEDFINLAKLLVSNIVCIYQDYWSFWLKLYSI